MRIKILLTLLIIFVIAVYIFPRNKSDRKKLKKIFRMYEGYKKAAFKNVPGISIRRFFRLRNTSRMVLVDVRSPEEMSVSIIPGAITKKAFEKMKYKNRIIVVYCTIGYRSGVYVKKLKRNRGFNLKGGILAWVHAGLPIYKKRKQTKLVHVYGKRWSLLPAGYIPSW